MTSNNAEPLPEEWGTAEHVPVEELASSSAASAGS